MQTIKVAAIERAFSEVRNLINILQPDSIKDLLVDLRGTQTPVLQFQTLI